MKLTNQTAHISFSFEDVDEAGLCAAADGMVAGLTGNIYITVVPIAIGPVGTAGTIMFQSAALRGLLSQRAAGNKSVTLSKQISAAATTLMLSLIMDGHSVQDQANVLAAGNLVQAQKIISSTGYKLSKTKTPKLHGFGAISNAVGSIFAHHPKAKKGAEAHLWRIGITTAKGVIALVTKTYVTPDASVITDSLPSGSIISIQHASMVSGTRLVRATGNIPLTGKKATPVAVSKGHHTVFSWTVADPYNWTDALYVVVS
ncbi:MAG: hypothetical protein ACYDCN_02110 [Bacteroidia bacterium]